MASMKTKQDLEKSAKLETFSKYRSQSVHGTISQMLDGTNKNEVKAVTSKTNQRKKKMKHRYSLPLEECRRMYRNETSLLWREVEEFRIKCQQQMDKQRSLLVQQNRRYQDAIKVKHLRGGKEINSEEEMKHEHHDAEHVLDEQDGVPDRPNDYTKELKKLERNMNLLEKKQRVLDKEQQLIEREEYLAKRQEQLKEYEKDVNEVEAMLDKRQSLADKRSKDVELLNDDLLTMKHELEESVETLEESTTESSRAENASDDNTNLSAASIKARRNWSLAKKHLLDKMTLLEATVQRYRIQLASTTTTVTAKDMVISRLNTEVTHMQEEMNSKDRKIIQLESQLSLTLEEKARTEKDFEMLMEELQNIDFSSSLKVHCKRETPECSPSKPLHVSFKQRLLKKRNSSHSFFHSDSERCTSPPTKEGKHPTSGFNSPSKRGFNHTGTNGNVQHAMYDNPSNNVHHAENEINNSLNASSSGRTSENGSKACIVM